MKLLNAIVEAAKTPPREGMTIQRVDVGPFIMNCIYREIKDATGVTFQSGPITCQGITITPGTEGFGTHRVDLIWYESLTRSLRHFWGEK